MSAPARQEIVALIADLDATITSLAQYVDDPKARDTRNRCIALRDQLGDLIEARS